MASMRSPALLTFLILVAATYGCQTGKDHLWSSAGRAEPGEQVSDDWTGGDTADAVHRKNSLLLAKATLYEADNKPGEAARIYEAVLKSEPEQAEALHRLAILQTNQGDFTAADRYFQRALQVNDSDAQLHNDYGYFCHLQRKTDAALEHLLKAVALEPELPTAHTNLGLVYARMGRYGQAQTQFRLAGCTSAESHSNVAFSRLMESDFAGARTSYETALRQDPNLASARRGLDSLNRLAESGAAGNARENTDGAAPNERASTRLVSYRSVTAADGGHGQARGEPRSRPDEGRDDATAGETRRDAGQAVERITLAPARPAPPREPAAGIRAATTPGAAPVHSTLRIVGP